MQGQCRGPEGFEAAVREAVESRILPLAGGRSNLAGRRFPASRYGLPSSPWDFLSRGFPGGSTSPCPPCLARPAGWWVSRPGGSLGS
jgi:hypothetical protein